MAVARMPVNLTWTGATGSPGVNIWHLRSGDEGIPTGDDFQQLIDAVALFYTAIRPLFPSSYTFSFDGELQGVGSNNGTTYTALPWSQPGFGGTDFMPPANAMFVNWSTNSGGRRGRGRTFLGPMATVVQEPNGTPTEPARTTVQNAAADLIETTDTIANGAIVVYSRTDNVARDITGYSVPNMFAVLRSRRD